MRRLRSNDVLVISGVPRRSILGPLLFVFINDIIADLNVKYLIYADDVKICHRVDYLYDCRLQDDVNNLSNWCSRNNLLYKKCSIASYTKKNPVLYDYCLDGVKLNRPGFIVDLEVKFGQKLTFNEHLNDLKVSYKTLRFVIRNASILNGLKSSNFSTILL